MIIKEQNGWKLLKKEDIFYLVCPSGEEVKLSITHESNLNNCFNHAVKNNWTWLKRTYYTVSHIKSKIVVSKQESNMVRSDKLSQWEKNHYLTEAQAKQAINDVLPKAEEHFNTCLQKHKELTKELGFSIGYNYEGDSHGIYDEYQYISFKMEGFDFNFEIE